MTAYLEKLKDPRWQKKRLEIMERDKFTCQACNATDKTLNVHHKAYESGKNPWDYAEKDLITFCEECHEKLKTNGQRASEIGYKELSIPICSKDICSKNCEYEAVVGIYDVGKDTTTSFLVCCTSRNDCKKKFFAELFL